MGVHIKYTRTQVGLEMAEESDNKILEFYKAIFATYDKNGDGTIDTAELGVVLKALGRPASEEKLAELIKQFDVDQNGKLDWTNGEFLLVVATIDVADVEMIDDLIFSTAFRTFDQDADCRTALPTNGLEGGGCICGGSDPKDGPQQGWK